MDNYWENRYKAGGNSGLGSYGEYAKHKAEVINKYIAKYNIKTISDFGCGDGNQISLFTGYESYMGYDISPYALNMCKTKFLKNEKMKFCSAIADLPEADLCISLDVIYHIIDEGEYKEYLIQLFDKSKKHVLIFSSDHSDNSHLLGLTTCPIFHRKITDWITVNHSDFALVEKTSNFLQTSALFHLYEKKQ
jgi:SAM-dependent methyltransferase